ncbi:MAG: hypothetical protein ACOC8K_02775, partial [Gemmatimonadota bacterium]
MRILRAVGARDSTPWAAMGRAAMGRAAPSGTVFGFSVLLIAISLSGCAEEEPAVLPSASEVESYYIYPRGLEASAEETAVAIRAVQPAEHLERGG